MKKANLLFFIIPASLSFFYSCNSEDNNTKAIASDSASIARGEAAFTKNCSGCHNFTQDGIGPQLAGITEQVPPTWISAFIHDPQKTIDGGDERAKKLFEKYPLHFQCKRKAPSPILLRKGSWPPVQQNGQLVTIS